MLVALELQLGGARAVLLEAQILRVRLAETVGVREPVLAMATGDALRLQAQAQPLEPILPRADGLALRV